MSKLPLDSPNAPTGRDPYGDRKLRRLMLFIYLTPILGTVPSLWTILTSAGDRKQQRVSRISILMAFVWLSGSLGLTLGGQQTEASFLPFLLVSSLWTSGYLLLSLGLMARLWKNQPLFPSVLPPRKR